MDKYDKFISNTAKQIRASEIREILAIIRARKDVISLAGGIPDPRTFPKEELAEIAKHVILDLGDTALQYSETKGILEVREIVFYLHTGRGCLGEQLHQCPCFEMSQLFGHVNSEAVVHEL